MDLRVESVAVGDPFFEACVVGKPVLWSWVWLLVMSVGRHLAPNPTARATHAWNQACNTKWLVRLLGPRVGRRDAEDKTNKTRSSNPDIWIQLAVVLYLLPYFLSTPRDPCHPTLKTSPRDVGITSSREVFIWKA